MCRDSIMFIVQKFAIPIFVAVVTYWLIKKNDDNNNRRQYSTLGVAIMESLLEEVNNGIDIMRNRQLVPLPVRSWDGVKTVSDKVLLRIIAVSKGVSQDGFPPREIRIHCKNYFEHMSANWNDAIRIAAAGGGDLTFLNPLLVQGQYLQAAEGVRKMLTQCKELLEKNARRKLCPK